MNKKAINTVGDSGLKGVKLKETVKRLEWDTNFFGMNIATLCPFKINEKIARYALNYCKKNKIKCLYYLSDCHDPESVRVAEKYGFHFVDIRLTSDIKLQKYVPKKTDPTKGLIIRDPNKTDANELKKIARKSYTHSRYYFDRHFPTYLCEKFYSTWVEKYCKNEGKCLVAEYRGRPVGYITCDIENEGTNGRIILVGVHNEFTGKGIGTTLVHSALKWFKKEGVSKVEVVTQGRNYGAQRLYQKCGFRTSKTQLWYHKWFGEEHKKPIRN